MTPPHSQELALRGIRYTTNAYKLLITLPTLQYTNFMDLSPVELASLQGNKQACNLCQAPNSSSEGTISGIRLPCTHIFCEECTFIWFHPRKFRNGCPSCSTEFFEILYVDEDDDEGFENGGAEEADDELSDGAQSLEDEDEDGHEFFGIARSEHEVEDRQMTSELERSVGGVESLIALGGPGCAVAAATTTALEMSQVARSRTYWLLMSLSANDFSKHDRVDGEVSGLGTCIGYDGGSD